MGKIKNLVGMKFGRLTVIGPDEKRDKSGKRYWRCVCDCGATRTVSGSNLTWGHTLSCGCLWKERTQRANTTHGKTGTRAYKTWTGMIERCCNANSERYQDYGGRGIEICERWRSSFESFYADMGDPPRGASLDRIDVNGNYEPKNCRWASDKEQANNTRRNRFVKYNGEELTLVQLSEKVGVGYKTLHARLKSGWSLKKAVNTPVRNLNFRR